MKRTPPWVFVAAVGIQLAALCLCVWAMELVLRTPDEETEVQPSREPARPPEPAPKPEPPPMHQPQPQPAPAATAPPKPEPEAAPETAPQREPQPNPELTPLRTLAQLADQAPAPMFGPPPEPAPEPAATSAPVPHFITENADAATQIVRGRAAGGPFAFGFYADGNIRFVDVDAGRYAGKAESARARMSEIEGMRAFTVQIGVGLDNLLQATFTGGTHDGETIALEPLVGWSEA